MFIFFFGHLLSIIMGSSHVFFLAVSTGSLFNVIAIESSHNLAHKQIYMKHGHVQFTPSKFDCCNETSEEGKTICIAHIVIVKIE
jgi:hypothetical protein